MNSLKRTSVFAPRLIRCAAMSGKGQGSAGAINEEGGVFGKIEVAREAEYFYKQQLEQLASLSKSNLSAEELLKKQIQQHEEALNRSKASLAKLKK